MTDTNSTSPISVSADTVPLAAAARYLLVMLGTFLVSKGYVHLGDVEGVATAILTVGTALYGLYRTFRSKQALVTVAKAASDDVAVVK